MANVIQNIPFSYCTVAMGGVMYKQNTSMVVLYGSWSNWHLVIRMNKLLILSIYLFSKNSITLWSPCVQTFLFSISFICFSVSFSSSHFLSSSSGIVRRRTNAISSSPNGESPCVTVKVLNLDTVTYQCNTILDAVLHCVTQGELSLI